MNRPPQIRDVHLRRRALLYVRQSSEQQVRENTGSSALQRDLAARLEAWGWSPDAIEVLDQDLGISGSRPEARSGFGTMIRRMEADEVGIVAVLDSSRLSRSLIDFAFFAAAAHRFDVLLAQGEQIIDFADPNAKFIATVLGSNAERENDARIELSRRARIKKAEAGIAPSGPPVGYTRLRDGSWIKADDPSIREVIQLLFDVFPKVGSARGLVRYLRQHKIRLPRRPRRGSPRWADATYDKVLRFLRHPAYAGTYVYNRQGVDKRAARRPSGKHRLRPRPASEWILKPGHHDAYVSPDEWAAIQARLARNRRTLAAPIGRGPALLQGILWCREHSRALGTIYPTRHRDFDGTIRRRGRYVCRPLRHSGDFYEHAGMVAPRLDEPVVREVLSALTPPCADVVALAVREADREHQALMRQRQDGLRRMELEAAEAERALAQVSTAHARVRHRLEARLEEALKQLESKRAFFALHPVKAPAALSPQEIDQLRQLLQRLPDLWNHARVTHDRRKALLRAVLERVWVTPGKAEWHLEIVWAGGATTAVDVPTDVGKRVRLTETFRYIHQRFSDGASARAILREVNAQETGDDSEPWTLSRIKNAIGRLQRGAISGLPPLARRRGLAARVIELHQAGLIPVQIVERLRAEGAVTLTHRPASLHAVYHALKGRGLTPHSVAMNRKVRAHLFALSEASDAKTIAEQLTASSNRRRPQCRGTAAPEGCQILVVPGVLPGAPQPALDHA